jgi:hypothetical protein
VTWTRGPDVYDRQPDDLGPTPGDDPFHHRAVSAGPLGIAVAETFDDGLHVWFEPRSAFGIAH